MKRQPKSKVIVYWNSTDEAWEIKASFEDLIWPYKLKDDATHFARQLAKSHKAELIVKLKNGRIGWRNSYGNDPKHRKD